MEFKGLRPRLLAAVVDGILVLAVAWLVAWRLGAGQPGGFEFGAVPSLLASLAWLAYLVLLEGLLGTTVGKLLLGIRVVDARGARPGLKPALVRNLLRVVDFLPVFYLLGMALIATSRQRQRFGDRVAGTFAVTRAGARTMKASGAETPGAGGVPLVVAGLLAVLVAFAYLVWNQPGPVAQVAGALSNLPVVGGAFPKPNAPAPAKATATPSAPTPTVRPAAAPVAPTALPATPTPPAKTQPQAPTVATQPPTVVAKLAVPTSAPPPSAVPTSGAGASQSELRGRWKGTITVSGYTAEAMSAEDRQLFEDGLKAMQGKAQTLEMAIEPSSEDSGSLNMAANGDPLGPLVYRYQNGRIAFEYQQGGARGSFEGTLSRQASGLRLDGTMRATYQEAGTTITMAGGWTAQKQ